MSNPEIALNNSNNDTSNRWRILENYDKEQEKRVKSATNNLIFGAIHRDYEESAEEVRNRFKKEKIEKQPTKLQKIGREILAATFGVPKAIKEKQEREAMPAALAEFDRQQAQKEENARMQKEQEIREEEIKKQRAIERAAEKEAREKKLLAMDMISAMENYREFTKKRRFKDQRIQEVVERDIEDRLTKVDDLEIQSFIEGSGVEKRSVEYGNKEIDVYDLNGYPFSMLSHSIDYRLNSTDVDRVRRGELPEYGHVGERTAAKVFADPSAWDTVEYKIGDLNDRSVDMLANTLCTSLIRSWDKSIKQRYKSNLCYGFSTIVGGRLIGAYANDGGTHNKYGKEAITLEGVRAAEDAISSTTIYNEFLLHRYNENGEAIKPDYIIAENGKINEEMKKHAAYFGIPIVNINMDYYEEANKNE